MDNNFLHGMTPEFQASFNQFLQSNLAAPGAVCSTVQGTVPSARLAFATDASNADTISIGGQTFTFETTPGAPGATTQVTRGVSAAATRASLVNAINGVADPTVVPATTPFAEPIVADVVGTSVRIRLADKQGGNPITGTAPSIALAEGLTPAGDIWNCANLNVSGSKPAANGQIVVRDSVTVTAQMVTAGGFDIELPFAIKSLSFTVQTSTGAQRAITDTITISGNTIVVAIGGASIAAGDVINFTASS